MTRDESDGDDEVRYVVTIIQPLKDFEEWKRSIPEIDKVSGKYILAREVYQSLDDPNEVLVHCEVKSAKSALSYLSEDVRDALDRTGVEFYPPAFAGREVVELRIERH